MVKKFFHFWIVACFVIIKSLLNHVDGSKLLVSCVLCCFEFLPGGNLGVVYKTGFGFFRTFLFLFLFAHLAICHSSLFSLCDERSLESTCLGLCPLLQVIVMFLL